MSDADGPYRAPRPGRSDTGDSKTWADDSKAWADTKDAHRLIAEALSRLVAADPTIPPHPYLSRHLAQHAARGEVLDDAHVPLAVLPWESSANVRTLLRQSDAVSAARRQEWLEAWARIEPFIGGAGPDSRLTSLHLAHHAATRPRTPLDPSAARVSGSRITPLWSDWTAQDNVLAVSETRLESLTRTTTTDGRSLLVSGDNHGTIRMWEPHGVPAMAPLHTYGGAVQHLLPLPGDLLLSAGTDGSVRVWHLTRGQLLAEPVHRPGTWVSALTLYAAKGAPEVVLVAHSDGRLGALDPVTFRPVDTPLPSLDPAPALLGGVSLGGAEGMALAVAQGRRVRVWDPRRADGYTHEHEHEGAVRALVDLAAPGRYALCDDSGYIGFRDASTGRETAVAPAPPAGPAIALTALTVAGRAAVASGGSDHTLRVWDARTGAAIGGPLEGHTAPPVALTTLPGTSRELPAPAGQELLAPAGQEVLVSAGADHTLRRWKPGGPGVGAGRAVRRPVTAAALFGPGSTAGAPLIAVADESGTALWDTGTGRPVPLPTGHATVTAFASTLVRGEPLLVTAHSDAGVQLWSLDRGAHAAPARLAGLLGHSLPVRSMAAFPHDGRTLLVTGGADGTVRLWDLDRVCALACREDHLLSVRDVAVLDTAQGPRIVSAGTDGTVRLWDPVTLRPVGAPLHCEQRVVNAVAAVPLDEPDGAALVASGGEDGTIRLWDPGTGRPVGRRLDIGDGPVAALAFFRTATGRPCLAATGPGGTIHVWDTDTGSYLLRIVTGSPLGALDVLDARQPGGPHLAHPVLLAAGVAGVCVFDIRMEGR
ncbi:WD40 repeat domain-containing protein [Streptomyces mirabilis]|uniref:WD40 repeat domain-containing protein n=1 Tax=Streptomyces mirabilis TaxID=68239 RepID=UPI0021BE3159|nr:WD40 repeat domain-containing protein [Streptomyces mirabilis]MCT9111760.1 WD40 repeat domain-containing protein [Streptomyces mirabilis]